MNLFTANITKKVPIILLIAMLMMVAIVGSLPDSSASAFPQSGHAFYGSVTDLEGGSVPYDPAAPTDPTRTTMIYARDFTRTLNFDGYDDFSSGEYFGRPVTVDPEDEDASTRYGWSPQAFIFPAYDQQDSSVPGARPGDEIEFYICPPGCEMPGRLVTVADGSPLRAVFQIGGQTELNLSADVVFTISGNAGMAGVVLHYSIFPGEPLEVIADEDGNYVITVPNGWSGVVTPELEGYVFGPAFIEYTDVTEDWADQDYEATLLTFTISGNAGVAGAVLHFSIVPGEPLEVIADEDGNYVIEVPYGWSGVVTPVLEGYVFDPAFYSYEKVTEDLAGENYTANEVEVGYFIYFPLLVH